MHPKRGTFTVDIQRLKPYFRGRIHANKKTIPLSVQEVLPVGSQTVPVFRNTSLRCRAVELTTLNKALLGRKPKLFELFLSVV